MDKSNKRKKVKKWCKPRHKFFRWFINTLLTPYFKLLYHLKVRKFKDNKRQFVILFNHQTPLDQFIITKVFKNPIYFIASEDLFSNGWLSKAIVHTTAPIPIKKQTGDPRAIINCIKIAKEGGTISLSPEGNRTYSGKTEYMNPTIVPLVKKLGLPLALFRIEGGYGVQPRWSNYIRKGHLEAYVSRVIEPEEYKNMTDDELFEFISKELYVNEGCVDYEYHHKRLAENMERVFYVCPDCGLVKFTSKNDAIKCAKCGMEIKYLPSKELKGVGFDFPFRFTTEWYDYQNEFISKLDIEEMANSPIYEDTATLSEVILYKNKKKLHKNAKIQLYTNKIVVTPTKGEAITYSFDEATSVTVLGRSKVDIYIDNRVFQLKGDRSFNGIKYVNFYTKYRNMKKGDKYAKFLGL
ncbi:MAG: 1-acyl-sn-glycerol-3-phosphate acyltransferase [Clostridia bacterium]|nr:1-acyl-sn-glycerol-3-phosphate acyltransferase [Clostridia bacterium]